MPSCGHKLHGIYITDVQFVGPAKQLITGELVVQKKKPHLYWYSLVNVISHS